MQVPPAHWQEGRHFLCWDLNEVGKQWEKGSSACFLQNNEVTCHSQRVFVIETRAQISGVLMWCFSSMVTSFSRENECYSSAPGDRWSPSTCPFQSQGTVKVSSVRFLSRELKFSKSCSRVLHPHSDEDRMFQGPFSCLEKILRQTYPSKTLPRSILSGVRGWQKPQKQF